MGIIRCETCVYLGMVRLVALKLQIVLMDQQNSKSRNNYVMFSGSENIMTFNHLLGFKGFTYYSCLSPFPGQRHGDKTSLVHYIQLVMQIRDPGHLAALRASPFQCCL